MPREHGGRAARAAARRRRSRPSEAAVSRRLATSARQVGAAGQVPLEAGPLDVVERVHGVGAGQCVDVAHDAHPLLPSRRATGSVRRGCGSWPCRPGGRASWPPRCACSRRSTRASMASRWTSVRPASAVRTRRASNDASAASAVESWSTVWFASWYAVSRRLAASAERTRSTALRCAIVSSQRDRAALVGVEPAGGPPDLEVGLLGDLLGLGRVADDPDARARRPGRRWRRTAARTPPRRRGRSAEQLREVGQVEPADRRAVGLGADAGASRGPPRDPSVDRPGTPRTVRRSCM